MGSEEIVGGRVWGIIGKNEQGRFNLVLVSQDTGATKILREINDGVETIELSKTLTISSLDGTTERVAYELFPGAKE